MNRDELLPGLRPAIDTEPTAVSPAERFQNQTLRPILKLQNELLLEHWQQYLHKRKQPFARLTPAEQLAYMAHSVQTDQKFKNRLVGLIVGHFTLAEWETFVAHEAELTRRIVRLLVQRLHAGATTFAP